MKEYEQIKKAIACIKQWIVIALGHHVENETNAYNLWKKLSQCLKKKLLGIKCSCRRS